MFCHLWTVYCCQSTAWFLVVCKLISSTYIFCQCWNDFLPPLILYFSKEWYVLNIILPVVPLAGVKVLIRWKIACVNAIKANWSMSSTAKHGKYIHSNHQYSPTQHTVKVFCILYTQIYLQTSRVQYTLILYNTALIILSNFKHILHLS